MKLQVETLAGIVNAQKKLDDILPVIAGRSTLLEELQRRVAGLTKDECVELMEALISLQSHCRVLGMGELDLKQ